MLLIIFVYQEPLERRAAERKVRGGWEVFTQLIRLPGFLLALFVIFGLQTVDRSFGPVLAAVRRRRSASTSARIPIVAGVLFSLGAISAAVGSQLAPRLLSDAHADICDRDRHDHRGDRAGGDRHRTEPRHSRASPSSWPASRWDRRRRRSTRWPARCCRLTRTATGFGIMTTASLLGLAVSPVAAGLIGSAGLRIVFIADVFLLMMLGVLVWRGLRSGSQVARDSGDAALAEP